MYERFCPYLSVGISVKDKALRVLAGESKWEDFSGLLNSPGWALVVEIPKLSAIQRFCILALAQGVSSPEELEVEAGLHGGKGLTPGVKAFWRTVAQRLASVEPYRAMYRATLDSEFKKNEALGFAHQAASYLPHASEVDRAYYSIGKLPLNHLKLRARMNMLQTFFRELLRFMRNDV